MRDPVQLALGATSGSVVGLILGLAGGGGSLLAIPMLIHVVGLRNVHVAVGTGAFAVAACALVNLVGHLRVARVPWRAAGWFGMAGILAALLGAGLGKQFDGARLQGLFALVMLAAAGLMIRRRFRPGLAPADARRESVPKLVGFGGATGLMSGFFGIGGGFLVVPGLVAATGMPLVSAVGCSLVVITAFGLTTGLSYALSEMVDWVLVLAFGAGGAGGGLLGLRLRAACAVREGLLETVLAALIAGAGLVMLLR
ncbi:sulfite exporter TauE/SafE family protein [Methylobacterium sp. Leaf118]|uniref:sulfite exporter TauE/SafE family protein n=1 Tax=Methylobacterium sp. Leaf118 TaxID=2876562 RepID=UPI001E3C60A4|nr:sulfite exporter TauE/SafE family protein [Methylobacterium sp. Leaf118]